MSEYSEFLISQRHYDLVIQQARVNLPAECGGFFGGKENFIQGVFPVFNQHLYDKTSSFGVSSEDIQRAHEFFAKHGLGYLGVYHTHPQGVAEPSAQDLSNRDRFLFIIGMSDPDHPVFAAFQAFGYHVRSIPVRIIENRHVMVKDLGQGASIAPDFDRMFDDAADLSQKMGRIKRARTADYPKERPVDPFKDDGFSTVA